MKKHQFLSITLLLASSVETFAQIAELPYLENIKEVSNVVKTESKTSVKMTEFAKSDVQNEVEGSQNTYQLVRKINITKQKNECQLSRIISRLIWKDGSNITIYDSENPFERSDIGDSFAEQWDRFIKKPLKIKYSLNRIDTLQKIDDFMIRWNYGYLPLENMSKYPEWDFIFFLNAKDKSLNVGFEWTDSVSVEGINIIDRYIVTSVDEKKAKITFFRNSTPLKTLSEEDITKMVTVGSYFLGENVTGIINIDKTSLIIDSMDLHTIKKRLNVQTSYRVQIQAEVKSTITNQVQRTKM